MTRIDSDMADAHYALRDDETGTRLARWHTMEGFFVGDWTKEDLFEDPDSVPSPRLEVTLDGLEMLADLAGYLDEEDGSYAIEDAVVEVLDTRGSVLGSYNVAWAALETGPKSTGTLWGDTQLAPHRAAKPVWDRWRSELPQDKGSWSTLPPGDREGWLEAAMLHYFHNAHQQGRRGWPMPDDPIVLDGHHVTDLASLFCAVGEAFNGPGGYFGGNFSALDDCLHRLDRPDDQRVSMTWKNIAIAERTLVRTSAGTNAQSYFDMAASTFSDNRVDIIRA